MVSRVLALILYLAAAPPGLAQESPLFRTPILTIDQERLFSESLFGQRAIAEIERKSEALAAENRRIEADLIDEERDLTERRASLPPDEFRALADGFDDRVQGIRAEQDAKARAIAQLRDDQRQVFYSQITGTLSQIVRERGAVVVVERGSVFLSADSIDVTDEAISRVDRLLDGGQGGDQDQNQDRDPAPAGDQ